MRSFSGVPADPARRSAASAGVARVRLALVRLAVAAGAVSLLLAAPAHGAPFVLGEGSEPNVAVDPAGTAYIAWRGPGETLRFCRLPRGASTCAVQSTIDTGGGQSLSRPFVSVTGARVVVAQYRYGYSPGAFSRFMLAISNDGGDTFGPAASVGPTAPAPFDEAIAGPGDTILTASQAETAGALVQSLPLPGGTTAGPATLFTDRPYNGTVGLAGATPLAIFTDGLSDAAFRTYSGLGSINDAASWTAPVAIGYADYPRLAGGPAGLFLLHGTADRGLMVRTFNGSTFPDGVVVSATGDDAQSHLFEDAGGRLHAVWSRIAADGFHLDHAVSDGGVSWSSGSLVLQSDDIAIGPRVAAAPDHVGLAVWESRTGGTSQIRASALGPGAPAAAAPPGPGPGPAPGPGPDPVPEFKKTVVVRVVSGKVRVRLKGSKRFVDLSAVDDIPFGSTIDARRGRLELASRPSRTGAIQRVQLYSGQFSIAQRGSITELRLNERLAPCRRARRARARTAGATSPDALATAAKKRRTRKLWADGKGRFRTRGQYGAATVRGTRWLVQDSCAGTLIRVKAGSVVARDFARGKNIIVRRGKSYTARPRR